MITAVDARIGETIRLMLGAHEWEHRPRRLTFGERTVKIGWFNSQPAGLLIATGDSGARLDLLVIPPATGAAAAERAMAAATSGSLDTVDILRRVVGRREPAEDSWESEGGRVT